MRHRVTADTSSSPVLCIVVPCARTDVTKLIVAFRNYANAPKNLPCFGVYSLLTVKAQSSLYVPPSVPLRNTAFCRAVCLCSSYEWNKKCRFSKLYSPIGLVSEHGVCFL